MYKLFLMLASSFFVRGLSDTDVEPTGKCRHLEFKCANNYCIPYLLTCDGDIDCFDESDEDPAMCKKRKCPPEMPYKCEISGRCIPAKWLCDEEADCPEGSDEYKLSCEKKIKLLNGQNEADDNFVPDPVTRAPLEDFM